MLTILSLDTFMVQQGWRKMMSKRHLPMLLGCCLDLISNIAQRNCIILKKRKIIHILSNSCANVYRVHCPWEPILRINNLGWELIQGKGDLFEGQGSTSSNKNYYQGKFLVLFEGAALSKINTHSKFRGNWRKLSLKN